MSTNILPTLTEHTAGFALWSLQSAVAVAYKKSGKSGSCFKISQLLDFSIFIHSFSIVFILQRITGGGLEPIPTVNG